MVTRGGEYCLGEGMKGGLGSGVELIHCLGVDCVLVTQSYRILGNPPWTVAHQFPLSTGFSRQEHWSGWPRPPAWGASRPRDQTQVSHMVGGFFTL